MEVVSKGHQGDLPECRSYMGETAERTEKKLRVRGNERKTQRDRSEKKSQSLVFQIK